MLDSVPSRIQGCMQANFVRPAKILWVRDANQEEGQDKDLRVGVWHEQNFLMDLGGECVFALVWCL